MIEERTVIAELAKIRRGKNLSQRAIAKKIGISYVTVQGIESGRVGIWLGDAFRWLEACDVDPALFFSEYLSKEAQKERDANNELLAILRRALKLKDRRAVIVAFCHQWQAADVRDDKGGRS